ncbi:hypothetical protein [Primorskyibacter sp. 2E233]|uniref:hypothetical protein n=1 Tax=Primorskyibacter sp. 2E233 TaxID=3413431 RepID=UPI003BF25D7B
MDLLIWIGAVITVAGLVGLIWCILRVAGARKAGLDDDALREVVRKTVTLNMAALFCSVIGLMMVIMGVFLG